MNLACHTPRRLPLLPQSTQPSSMALTRTMPKASVICATTRITIIDHFECTSASSLHHVRLSHCRFLRKDRRRTSHRRLETNNRDLGAGFGSPRPCVQPFLCLGIYSLLKSVEPDKGLHHEGATTMPETVRLMRPHYGEYGDTVALPN